MCCPRFRTRSMSCPRCPIFPIRLRRSSTTWEAHRQGARSVSRGHRGRSERQHPGTESRKGPKPKGQVSAAGLEVAGYRRENVRHHGPSGVDDPRERRGRGRPCSTSNEAGYANKTAHEWSITVTMMHRQHKRIGLSISRDGGLLTRARCAAQGAAFLFARPAPAWLRGTERALWLECHPGNSDHASRTRGDC